MKRRNASDNGECGNKKLPEQAVCGLSSPQESTQSVKEILRRRIEQNAIEEILTGIRGCKNISDDIIVYRSPSLHGLLLFMEKLRRNIMRTSLAYWNGSSNMACTWTRRNAFCWGVRFSSFSKNGVEADPAKIKAIIDMSQPESVIEVKSLLGMAQYVSCWIPNYATITVPLRLLTKKDTSWQWADEQQRAFDKLKDSLTKNHVVSYFNPRLKTEVI